MKRRFVARTERVTVGGERTVVDERRFFTRRGALAHCEVMHREGRRVSGRVSVRGATRFVVSMHREVQ